MVEIPIPGLAPPLVGTVPAFRLQFTSKGKHVLDLDERSYRAEIETSLPGGIEPGSTTIRLLGLTEEDSKKLHEALVTKGELDLDLSLGWRERPKSILVKVSALRVSAADRRADGLRWTGVIEARERAYALLDHRRVKDTISAKTATEAAAKLIEAQPSAPKAQKHGNDVLDDKDKPPEEAERGVPVIEALQRLLARCEERSERFGRGAGLIRDGVIHLGTDRKIPFGKDGGEGKVFDLAKAATIIEVRAREPQLVDPQFDFARNPDREKPPFRRRFELRLIGSPGIRPGDVVSFNPPDAPNPGSGLLNALVSAASALVDLPGAEKGNTQLYVETVTHRLAQASGFTSSLIGVVINGPKDEAGIWDKHSLAEPGRGKRQEPKPEASPAGRIASLLSGIAQQDDGKRSSEVGEIRGHQVEASGSNGGLSSQILEGQAVSPKSAGPRQSTRVDINRVHPKLRSGVPYLTPFAFGKFGQVLPRLPGMRVLLTYRGGDPADPVDLGSFRGRSDEAPKEARTGDWWLILPAGGDIDSRQDGQDPVAPPDGPASDDLIDSHGNRIIEVGSLSIRVGEKALDSPGIRPEVAEAGSVVIEHSDGKSSIVMKADGTIIIEAGSNLTIKAKEKLTLDAKNVEVNLGPGGTMDVKGG
jgi:hypothetical protein